MTLQSRRSPVNLSIDPNVVNAMSVQVIRVY
jgi:hypothetical protein